MGSPFEIRRREVERILGYDFKEPRLLKDALTSPSYHPQTHYERLQFLGDALLGVVVAEQLYDAYPTEEEGVLTMLHSANVDTERLARVALSHGLHHHLHHQLPDFDKMVDDFRGDIDRFPRQYTGLIDPPKFLSDVVEALLGAVLIDSGESREEVSKVFGRLCGQLVGPEDAPEQPVKKLKERREMERKTPPDYVYDTWEEDRTVRVFLDGVMMGSATYDNKKIAENRAAKAALDRLAAGEAA